MKFHTTRRDGFTLIEMMISFTVLAALLGAVAATVMRGQATYEQGMTIGSLEARARQTLDRIAAEFTSAMRVPLVPSPVMVGGSSTFTCSFQRCTGFAGGAMQWTPTAVRLQASPSDPNDGVDNNSNGLVDECQIVLVRNAGAADEQTVALAGFVREYFEGETLNAADDNGNGLIDERGLSFSLVDADDDSLTIRLTLEALDTERRVITRSVETAIHVRN
jgi:prepilin-type N-terminal cleavage/methylation domain-containing protein